MAEKLVPPVTADPDPSPLLRNLLLFGRLLRLLGLRVTSGQMIELSSSLDWIDIGNRQDFRNTARALLVTRHEDLAIFDRAFDAFWRAVSAYPQQGEDLLNRLRHMPERRERSGSPSGENVIAPGQKELRVASSTDSAEGDDEEESEEPILALYSRQEALRNKDFSAFSEEEVADARRFLTQLRWAITKRRSRRVRPSPRGRRLDVRRSLRRSLRHGGEMLDLAHRGPKLKRRQLVLICDISGSMERYTRLLLHFLYSVEASVQQAEVFVFGTRLTRVTRQLRGRDPDASLRAVADEVQDWSGGTRIGESLRIFNQQWSRRVLGHGAIVLIISDGWDRGEPEILAEEMARLQRSSFRLIWLNPLLGSEQYRPLTQGIVAALPYVDDFLPVHNLQSLESLAVLLNQIQEGRPDRKQRIRSESE